MGSLFWSLLLLSSLFLFSSASLTSIQSLSTLSFDEGYNQVFGDSNLMLLREGRTVHLSLDQRTGSGFVSQDLYLHGFFSASIKLPSDYSAGVVVAFYMSNGDVFEKTHDELDFEFLGNIRGREWRVQTNVYGNGSTSIGREERYDLWFDPTQDFHQYSILWTHTQIIFYVDSIPIREIERESMGEAFPSKPMSLYATIWDGSSWATSGGRYKVNYNYAPYIAEFTDLVLQGCAMDPIENLVTSCINAEGNAAHYNAPAMSSGERTAMRGFRRDHITYFYCYDRKRYPVPPPECGTYRSKVGRHYKVDGSIGFGDGRRHGRGRSRRRRSRVDGKDVAL